MLDINLIRKDKKLVMKALHDRNMKFDIDKLLDLDFEKRKLQTKVDELRAKQNTASDEIAKLNGPEKQQAILDIKGTSERLKDLESKCSKLDEELSKLMLELPNIPRPDVKVGKNESENEIIKKVGEPTKFDFEPKDHLALGEKLDLIDTKRAGKVSGSRFNYLKRELVLLEFALARFVIDELTKEGFIPVIPPQIVSEKAMQAMGYLAHGGEEETYHFAKDKQYFVGTSEQSVIPMHMNEVLKESDLPKRYIAFSTCFRREAGSYGKDTYGILRQHQFDKLEMLVLAKPEDSEKEQEFLLNIEERLVKALNLPYQVVKMCTGDLGDPAARKYDIETWIPSQKKYRETHSCSTCTDFQARRLNIKYRDTKKNKNELVHTLNATGFAIGRILIAIMENNQQKDGSIKIPEVLWGYSGIKEIKR
ncbi:MAG: serine--tRNA ligase [Patescibacteria group bacterium]|nr:serine--tRNA ligase [Patescibacteria group bacterium]